jgi:hypothetical protein
MEQADQKDDTLIERLTREGYQGVKRLESGEYAGVLRMIYTAGLFVGLDDDGYRMRYCYGAMSEATAALLLWDGQGDPPGGWIKAKGLGRDQLNPKLREDASR